MISRIIFAAYADNADELWNICRLGESLRIFGGKCRKAPVWAYVPDNLNIDDERCIKKLKNLEIDIRRSYTPDEAKEFYYSGKTFASARAETAAEELTEILVWLDEDTIVLDHPEELLLAPNMVFGYRPVMHNRAGSLYGAPPNEFWSRIYELLGITDEMLFPTVTHVDQQKIRAYFQAGLLAVRPEKGILRQWPKDFQRLYGDKKIAAMCQGDREKNVFLHQNALVGAVLHNASENEIAQLSDKYNYPLFFEQSYEASGSYNSIEEVATARVVIHLDKLTPELFDRLTGSTEKIAWLKERLLK